MTEYGEPINNTGCGESCGENQVCERCEGEK